MKGPQLAWLAFAYPSLLNNGKPNAFTGVNLNSRQKCLKIVNKCLLKKIDALVSMGSCLKWTKLGCLSMQGVKNLKKLSSEEVNMILR